MGDVFDALNRAKRSGEGAAAAPTPAGPPAESAGQGSLPLDEVARAPSGPERAALPLGEVAGAAQRQETARQEAEAPGAQRLVAAAAEKAQAQAQERQQEQRAAALLAQGTGRMNGYAPELVVHHDRGSVITEQYRAIRTQILARARNRRVQTHAVTSSGPEEGKSVTVINLGMTFAELRNHKTLLIEGDLRQPSFAKIFSRDCTPGLIQVLRGELNDIDQAIHHTVYDNLDFLPAGGREGTHATEMLSSPRMAQVLDRLKDRYDHIFIDTPPVVTVTDPCILGALADQVLMVVRLHRTPTDVVERAKRLLRAANCEVAGVILTHLTQERKGYPYRYAYGYGRYVANPADKAAAK